MMVKEIIPLEEIGFDHKFRAKIGTTLECNLEEIVRGVLLT